ncbi:MAG: DUF2141 domain-containing protein [Burkholderiaceae bacterium]
MRHRALYLATILLTAAAVVLWPAAARGAGGTVEVAVTGIRHASGTLHVTLCRAAEFGTPDCFRRATRPVRAIVTERFVFDRMPAGIYAVLVIHDVNGNRRFDRDGYGAPTEPWGASRNPRVRWRAPTFDECAVKYDGGAITLEVALQ